jgi:hypothetical protein
MWVFAELDNLEYVIAKFRLGYIEPEQAWRGVRTFFSRCSHDATFLERALHFSGSSGYLEATRPVVLAISRQLEQDRAVHNQQAGAGRSN